jgi:AcrR family transcriptional regulator
VNLREQKKLNTRNAILASADRLFRKHGYSATRINDIIEPAKISKKTFFNYFPSKNAVLAELARRWFQRYTTEAGSIASTESISPGQKLQDNLQARINIVAQDREFVAMLLRHTDLFQISANMDSLQFDIASQNFQEIRDTIGEAQAAGEFRNDISAEELNEIFVAVRNAIIIRWLLDSSSKPEDLQPSIQNAMKVLIKGFSP